MGDIYKNAYEQLMKGIRSYVDNAINKSHKDVTVDGVIIGYDEDGYIVNINNSTFSGLQTIGGSCSNYEIVKILIPQNNYNNMIILKGGNGSSNDSSTRSSSGVTSVNGKIGNVVLKTSDLENDKGYITEVPKQTVSSVDIENSDKKIKFGIDSNGNYGYYKDGADTVTPFLTKTLDFVKGEGVVNGKVNCGFKPTYVQVGIIGSCVRFIVYDETKDPNGYSTFYASPSNGMSGITYKFTDNDSQNYLKEITDNGFTLGSEMAKGTCYWVAHK